MPSGPLNSLCRGMPSLLTYLFPFLVSSSTVQASEKYQMKTMVLASARKAYLYAKATKRAVCA